MALKLPDASAALAYPFAIGVLPAPDAAARLLILGATPDLGLEHWRAYVPELQSFFKPSMNALQAAGWAVRPDLPTEAGTYDLVLVQAAHQHDESYGTLAAAARLAKPGGLVVAAAANDSGGKRLAKDFTDLGLPLSEAAKYKTRIVWTTTPEALNAAEADKALHDADFRVIKKGSFTACPGVFSWDRIDAGSQLLADHLPVLPGHGADFGCGAGFLSHVAFERGAESIACIDADWRAVESARRTLEGKPASFLWADIADPAEVLPAGLDWIVMNPPFHIGRAAVPALGQAFIARARASLRPGGVLWLVANAQLPYEAALTGAFATVDKIAEGSGYKICRATA